jgi:hypothetical protein
MASAKLGARHGTVTLEAGMADSGHAKIEVSELYQAAIVVSDLDQSIERSRTI